MVELSSSWLRQQQFPLESSAFRNRMTAPVEHRQHEFLPASKNPCRVSANLDLNVEYRQHEFLPASKNPCRVSTNLDLNGFGHSGFPERGLAIEGYGSIQKSVPHSQTPLTQNQYYGEQNPLFPATVGDAEKPSTCPAYEDVNDGVLIDALSERMYPTIGSKRPRKDKIHDTLRVLEGIIPGLKSKDPLVILDEAISYLKGLKYNAETMSSEDPDSSSSYEPLH